MSLFKGSRYERSQAFEPDAEGRPHFKGLRARPLPIPEAILEHAIAAKDRLDGLSQNYYREPRLWHRLAEANPDTIFAEDLLHQPRSAADRTASTFVVPHREEQRR